MLTLPPPRNNPGYTYEEAGPLLGVTGRTVQKMVNETKEIIPCRIGGKVFIPVSEVERLLSARPA